MAKQTQVTVTLVGKHDEVMEYVNMMLGDGMVTGLSFEEPNHKSSAPKPTRAKPPVPFATGDRVRVAYGSTIYNIAVGDTGKVTDVKASGRGRVVTVKWDDGSKPTGVAASFLERVRR